MKKPIQRYLAVYQHRFDGDEMTFEAKSDAGAARIAASYERQRRGAFTYRVCDLIEVLKYVNGSAGWHWTGVSRELVESRGRRRVAA